MTVHGVSADALPPSPARGTACCVCGETNARVWRVAGDNIQGGTEKFTAVRCVKCGTVRLQPRPSAEEMNRHYAPGTYARAEGETETSELDRRLTDFFERQAERATKAHGRERGPGRLLDVGCGDGRFMAAMQKRGWTAEGIETEPVSANLARRRTSATVHETPLEQTSYSAASYDMVSLLHVLEHVPDPRDTLTRAFALLKPGGTLLLALPNVWCAESALFGTSWYPLDLPRHYWGFTPQGLSRLVEECGFTKPTVRYFPFLFAVQSLRYKLRGAPKPQTASEKQTEPLPARSDETGSKGALKTRVFGAMLRISEKVGRSVPGEVMELWARKGEKATG